MACAITFSSICLVTVTLLLLAFNHVDAAESEKRSISREEYLELKRQLQFLNRPAVKSIKTKEGDIFDCVDINKQPALDHPLLKNHTIQMQPSSYPEGIKSEVSSSTILEIGLKGGGCPVGHIPIRRTQMQDLMRANTLSNFGKRYPRSSKRKWDSRIHYHATLRSKYNFYGTQARMNVWSPIFYVDADQFSISQIWVRNGLEHHVNSVEAGWQVFPHEYGDNRSHFFVAWTADDYHRTGCRDLLCPGFVHVSKEIPLGVTLQPVSTYNGPQYEIVLSIFKNLKTGDWWLAFGDDSKIVGYWPKSIFTTLIIKPAQIEWGGEAAYNKYDTHISPPMGSGHFAEGGFKRACYTKRIRVLDESYKVRDYVGGAYRKAESPKCYSVVDGGFEGGDTGRVLYFGGPGGSC